MMTRRDVVTIQEVRLTGFTEGLLIPLYSSLRGTESELTVTTRLQPYVRGTPLRSRG